MIIASPIVVMAQVDTFWYPDLVPHPIPPGNEPSGVGEPELC